MTSFKKTKSMVFPRQVLAGHNALPRITEMCRDFNLGGTCIIVTGRTTGPIAAKPVSDHLTGAGFDVHLIELAEATRENVDRVKGLIDEVEAKFLLGVGGGSKIDIAKLAAKECYMPFISIPTSGAHDGIASPSASIIDQETPHSIEAIMPIGVLADTEIISRSPFRLLASGCADVLSNFTAIRDWELAVRLKNEEFSTTAYTLAKMSATVIKQNAGVIKPMVEESAWIAIKPIISSGISMSIAGSSRPTSGSEHMFSHSLSMIAPGRALHGNQCGIGALMMMYLHGGPWEEIRESLRTLRCPTTARELGFSKEEVIKALTMAHTIRPERYTILGDNGLTEEAAERLANITGVV
jgi:glycerol-1-phosphate dehydrogenase [NAD(P)+]